MFNLNYQNICLIFIHKYMFNLSKYSELHMIACNFQWMGLYYGGLSLVHSSGNKK